MPHIDRKAARATRESPTRNSPSARIREHPVEGFEQDTVVYTCTKGVLWTPPWLECLYIFELTV